METSMKRKQLRESRVPEASKKTSMGYRISKLAFQHTMLQIAPVGTHHWLPQATLLTIMHSTM